MWGGPGTFCWLFELSSYICNKTVDILKINVILFILWFNNTSIFFYLPALDIVEIFRWTGGASLAVPLFYKKVRTCNENLLIKGLFPLSICGCNIDAEYRISVCTNYQWSIIKVPKYTHSKQDCNRFLKCRVVLTCQYLILKIEHLNGNLITSQDLPAFENNQCALPGT